MLKMNTYPVTGDDNCHTGESEAKIESHNLENSKDWPPTHQIIAQTITEWYLIHRFAAGTIPNRRP